MMMMSMFVASTFLVLLRGRFSFRPKNSRESSFAGKTSGWYLHKLFQEITILILADNTGRFSVWFIFIVRVIHDLHSATRLGLVFLGFGFLVFVVRGFRCW